MNTVINADVGLKPQHNVADYDDDNEGVVVDSLVTFIRLCSPRGSSKSPYSNSAAVKTLLRHIDGNMHRT